MQFEETEVQESWLGPGINTISNNIKYCLINKLTLSSYLVWRGLREQKILYRMCQCAELCSFTVLFCFLFCVCQRRRHLSGGHTDIWKYSCWQYITTHMADISATPVFTHTSTQFFLGSHYNLLLLLLSHCIVHLPSNAPLCPVLHHITKPSSILLHFLSLASHSPERLATGPVHFLIFTSLVLNWLEGIWGDLQRGGTEAKKQTPTSAG